MQALPKVRIVKSQSGKTALFELNGQPLHSVCGYTVDHRARGPQKITIELHADVEITTAAPPEPEAARRCSAIYFDMGTPLHHGKPCPKCDPDPPQGGTGLVR